jgi:hypothetical protein
MVNFSSASTGQWAKRVLFIDYPSRRFTRASTFLTLHTRPWHSVFKVYSKRLEAHYLHFFREANCNFVEVWRNFRFALFKTTIACCHLYSSLLSRCPLSMNVTKKIGSSTIFCGNLWLKSDSPLSASDGTIHKTRNVCQNF